MVKLVTEIRISRTLVKREFESEVSGGTPGKSQFTVYLSILLSLQIDRQYAFMGSCLYYTVNYTKE